MTFLNPLLLWGALAAAFPLLIHLWGRRRPRRVLFPSLRLIRVAQQQQRSYSRLRDLLILLLRMLLIGLLSLALAGPVVQSDLLASLLRSDQRVAVAIDVSASMAYRDGAQTVMGRAGAAAGAIARGLPRGVQVAFFEADAQLRPLPPGTDVGALQPGFAPGDLLEALSRSEAPEAADPRCLWFIITDLQQTTLRGELTQPFPQPPVVVDVGALKPLNRAVTDLHPTSPCPLRGGPVELEAVTQAWPDSSARDEPLDLSLEVQGRPAPGRSTPAEAGQHTTVLRFRPQVGGEVEIAASLPQDHFAADDTFRAILPVRKELRVHVLAGQAETRYLSLALNPGREAETHIRCQAVGDLSDLSPTDLAVMATTPVATDAERLLKHFAAGGGVLLFAGPGVSYSPELLRSLLGVPVRLGKTVAAAEGEPFSLSDLDTTGPPLEPFASPRAGDLLQLSFTHHRSLPGADDATVLARFSDGTPAVVGTLDPDRHCLLVNTSIDDRWSNAPFTPAYVPLMHRLCYDAVGPLRPVWPDWFAGHTLCAAVPEGAGPLATVTGPDGETHRVGATGGYWRFSPERPGIHTARWREREKELTQRFAANVSPLESDPTRIAPEELRRRLKSPQARIVRPEQLAESLQAAALARVSVTVPLLVLVVLGLILETALSAPRRRPTTEGAHR